MPNTDQTARRRLRLGLVGGGPGSHIGETHRQAARWDDRYASVAGVFATDPGRSREFAARLDIAPDRRYGAWQEMAEQEAFADGIEVVGKGFLAHGVDVICDKPLTNDLAQALELQRLAHDKGLVFAVTYNYSGYPMVRQARAMVRGGDLGAVRLVQVELASGWASTLLEAEGHNHGHFNPAWAAGLGYDDLKTIEAYNFLSSIVAGKQGEPGFAAAAAVARVQQAMIRSWASGAWESVEV